MQMKRAYSSRGLPMPIYFSICPYVKPQDCLEGSVLERLLENPFILHYSQERNANEAKGKSSWRKMQMKRAYSVGACKCQFILKSAPM